MIATLVRDAEADWAVAAASASARRVRCHPRPDCCAAPIRCVSTASRSRPIWKPSWDAKCASPTTRTALRCRRRPTARAAMRRRRIRRHSRHRRRLGYRRARAGVVGPQRDRGRVGPQSAAVAGRRRTPGPAMLLRAMRLHRDISVRPGHRARSFGGHRTARARAGNRTARSSKASPKPQATMLRYERRLAKALAHVINLLDPDVIVLGGGMSNIDRLYVDVPPRLGPVGVLGARRHAAGAASARRFERRARRRVACGTTDVARLTCSE